MKWASNQRVWCVIRILVGLIFAYAGISKLIEPAVNFETALMRYGVFSPHWTPWLARIVPWFEWVLGCFLTVGYLPRFAAGGVSLFSLSFLVTLGSSRLFLSSGETDCGCFGTTGLHLSLHQVFLLDLFNFLAALRLLFFSNYAFSLHSFLLKENRRGDDKSRRIGRSGE